MINYQTPGLVTKPSENILILSRCHCKNNFQLNRLKELMFHQRMRQTNRYPPCNGCIQGRGESNPQWIVNIGVAVK